MAKIPKLLKDVTVVYIDIYRTTVFVCFNKEQYNNVLKYHKINPERDGFNSSGYGGFVETLECDGGSCVFICCVYEKNYGTYIHELTHVCFNVMDYVGIDYIKNTGNESFTYMMGYLVKETQEKFQECVDKDEKDG